MTEAVSQAIEQIRAAFPGHTVEVEEDGQGGARVIVQELELGEQYEPPRGCIGFLIGFQYDASDVYPHFVVGSLKRVDNKGLGPGFSDAQWNGAPAVQISRRSNGWRRGVDTAAMKLQKVLEWLRTR